MTTYTLVTAKSPQGVCLLIGSPRDGDQRSIDQAIAGHREMEHEYRMDYDEDDPRRETVTSEIELIPGCVLTDDEPKDEDSIVWQGHSEGAPMDENGKFYKYAVRS